MRRASASLSAIALVAGPVSAMWMFPTDAPVDRLLGNLRARLAEAPEDAHRHYQRASGLAFALHARFLRVASLDGLAPGAKRGAWLADGRCVATWDWVAEPLGESVP